MNKDDLKRRTKRFALRVIVLVESLPKGRTADVLNPQSAMEMGLILESEIRNLKSEIELTRNSFGFSFRNPQSEICN